MKILKKLSLFVALIITTVAVAPAMPDAHAAGSLSFTNSDTIAYIDINISYSSDSTIEDSVDVVEPSDPLLCGEIITVPLTGTFDDNFDIILIDNNGSVFAFYNFDKSFSDQNVSFEIIYDANTQMAITVSAPGCESTTFWPDEIL